MKSEKITPYQIDACRVIYDKQTNDGTNRKYGEILEEMERNGVSSDEMQRYCEGICKKKEVEMLKNKLNLSKRYKNCAFDTFNPVTEMQEKALKQARNYIKTISTSNSAGTNLIIQGNGCVGTGKTHLACAIANELCANVIPVLFINAVEMFNNIRENWNNQEYKNVKALIIDDIGKEKPTEWACQNLYDIINFRYEELKPTIITIENNISDIQQYYNQINTGNAIIDRLIQDFVLITLTGESFRCKR